MRLDIQFLRGWAVSIVVLEHVGFLPSAGYLGVDVFFVISGYLITRLLQNSMEAGSFRFGDFYARRAKRLLPAAFATFALTTLAAPYFLSSIQLDAYRDQLLGALTFSANFVLYGQSGYFDSDAALKPLLHIWSLSLEEQYYFALPLLLFIVRRRFWTHVTTAAFIGSAGLCAYYLSTDPSFAFYSLPTRAWELSIGSLVALTRVDTNPHRLLRLAFWPAFAAVVLIPFFPTSAPHPSLDAVLVCIGTAIIIINGRQFFGRVYPLRATAWVGDASYSIYLAHWPIVAFANNAHLYEISTETRIALLALTIFFGLLLHYLVERPIHKSSRRVSFPQTIAIAAFCALLVAAPLQVSKSGASAGESFAEIRRPNFGLDRACDQGVANFEPLKKCIAGSQPPKVALWGDSLAMHLVQGLRADNLSLVQATRSSCPPAFGYAQFNNQTQYTEDWAHRCVAFNRSVFQYLQATPSIETVVIGSTFLAFTLNPPWQAVAYGRGGSYETVDIDDVTSGRALFNMVTALRSIGKKVVIFAPPPSGAIDYSECNERALTGLVTFDASDCSIPRPDDERRYGGVMNILSTLAATADVSIIDPREWMCEGSNCITMMNDIALYRDPLHLSVEGSTFLGKRYSWAGKVGELAR